MIEQKCVLHAAVYDRSASDAEEKAPQCCREVVDRQRTGKYGENGCNNKSTVIVVAVVIDVRKNREKS